MFQWCFKKITKEFEISFKDVSRGCQGRFNGVHGNIKVV